MAFTNTPVGPALATAFSRSYDIIASADADAADTITYSLNVIPSEVIITPISAKGITGLWSLTSVSATQVILAKGNVGAGSGDPAAQVRVTVRFPHSRIQ